MKNSTVTRFLESINFYLNYRKRFASIPGFINFYESENHKTALFRVRVLCSLAILLYSSVGIMEVILFPKEAPVFLAIRAAFAVVCVFVLLLSRTAWGERNILWLVFFNALFGDLGISYMSSQIGGWTSLYFVGNILVAMGMTMFIPWRPRMTAIYCTAVFIGYVGINGFFHPFVLAMLIPTMFIFIIGTLAFFSSMGNEISRMTEMASRVELEKAHEDLKKLDEAKVRFFANISHELRTPLTLIIGPLGALSKKGGTISQELIDSMTSNAQRLLRQVNALLDLGKVDSQEMKCNYENGNVKTVISDLYKAAAPGAKERGINLELQVPEQFPDSSFDIEKIETVIANLISNAIKFTPVGGTVGIIGKIKEDGFIRVSVKDTGPGIPQDQLTKIFARFHQVDDSAKKVSKGTGLGLSVAKEFAELHGGRIWVESEVGKGTEFIVEIPLKTASQGSYKMEENAAALKVRDDARSTLLVDIVANEGAEYSDGNIIEENKRRATQRSKEKPLVLYVDDNKDLRQYVAGILSDMYTVLLAQDGEQGLEQAQLYMPDLILSDVMMPKMNGFELCRRVRSEAKLKATPFVLLTANSSVDSRIEGLQDGADDYLSKPFSEQELAARVKNLIRLREQTNIIKKQIDAAKQIQRTLLPPMVQDLNGIKVEAIYEPSEELSGDFFDTLTVGEWVYVYLADVTGHGLPAAQITYLVKGIMKNALHRERDLSELFDVVREQYVAHKLQYDLGLQLARIHSKNLTFEYIRSNAPDPIMIDGSTEAKVLVFPISPLISAINYDHGKKASVSQMTLAKNEALYLYSDGAYEFTQKTGSPFGPRRLMRAVAATHAEQWPEGLTTRLKSENVEDFFPDDLTILRIKFS